MAASRAMRLLDDITKAPIASAYAQEATGMALVYSNLAIAEEISKLTRAIADNLSHRSTS